MAAAPGVLHLSRVLAPSPGSDAVQARYHGDRCGRGSAFQQAQVLARARIVVHGGGEIAECLAETVRRFVQQFGPLQSPLPELLFKQGEHHDRADARVVQPVDAIEAGAQRRGGSHQRVIQPQAQIAGDQVHQPSLRASAANS